MSIICIYNENIIIRFGATKPINMLILKSFGFGGLYGGFVNLLRICGRQPPKPQQPREEEDSLEDVEKIEPLMRSEGDGGGAETETKQ